MGTRREKIILEADDRASKEISGLDQRFSSFSKNVAKVTTTLLIGVGAAGIGKLGRTLFDAGVEAEEAASAFDTSFGSAVQDAGDFVDEFANKAGFATSAMQQQFAVLGNLIQGMGATEAQSAAMGEQMFRLAGDVASFSNVVGGAEPVLAALKSALGGEREALKTYGLALSEAEVQQRALIDSGKTHADQLTRLDKANATIALAYEKANKAVGDLDRTQDSAANRTRELSARWEDFVGTLGEKALPAMSHVLTGLEAIVGWLGQMDTKISVGVSRWQRWTATVSSAAKQDYNRLFNVLDVLAGPLINYAELSDDAEQATIDVANAIDHYAGAVGQGVDATTAFVIGLQEMERRGTELNIGLDQYISNLQLSSEEARAGLIATRGHAEALGLSAVEVSILNRRIAELTGIIIDEKVATMGAVTATQMASGAWAEGKAEADFWAKAVYGSGTAAEDAAADIRTLGQRIRGVSDAYLAAADPVFGAISAVQEYQQVLEDAGDPATRTAEQQIAIAEATLRAQAALSAVGEGNLVAGLDAIAASLGISRMEAAELAREMGILDGTEVRLLFDIGLTSGSSGRLQDINRAIGSGFGRRLDSGRVIVQSGGFINAPLGAPVPAMLHGQERVLTAAQNRTFDQVMALLVNGDIGGGASTTNNNNSLTLNITDPGGEITQVSTSELLDEAALTTLLSGVLS